MNWHVNSVGMTMLKIPAGNFVRKDNYDAAMKQTVTLTGSFLLADGEVTRAQFQHFIDDPERPDWEKRVWPPWPGEDPKYSPTAQHPVQNVGWSDAVRFCNWLSRQEKLAVCYERKGNDEGWRFIRERFNRAANGYRLPTEAE